MSREEIAHEMENTELRILEDLEKLQPEEIDELRDMFFAEHGDKLSENMSNYINVLCDVAKNRAICKMEVL